MTDRPPELQDDRPDPLPGRLEAWFQQEVHQAGADLRAAPLRSGRTRGNARRGPFGPLVAAAVVAIVVVVGLTRLPGLAPGTGPDGSAGLSPTTGGSSSKPSTTPADTPAASPVVDGRYPDGIPSSLDGRTVARPSNVERRPANDASFLLGGWSFDFGAIAWSCIPMRGTPPPFGPGCGTPFLAENPLMDELPRVMLDGWSASIPAGPVVLQVHRNDARAALCEPNMRVGCEKMAVIEGVVWAGDATTATTPRGPTDTFTRLIGADPNLSQATIEPARPAAPMGTGPHGRPVVVPSAGNASGACRPPYPTEAWSIQGSWITTVLVFPTVAARAAVDQNFLATGFVGTTPDGRTCQAMTDSAFLTTWVAIDNLLVAAQVPQSSLAPWLRFDAVSAALMR